MRVDLRGMPIYTPPGSQCLNLANNENFYTSWYEVIGNQISEIAQQLPFHQYGSSDYSCLSQAYANYLHMPSSQVLPAPGSDSLIPVLINALTDKSVITFDRDFFRYGQHARILKREHVTVPITSGIDGLIKAAGEHSAELIFFSNPNNPLGCTQKKVDLLRLLDEVDCYIAIDEAYAEYHGETVVDLVAKYPKLLVLRTMSKAWGLARLRIGFLIANAALIQFVKAVQGPFVMSDLNANIATAALEHESLMRHSVAETIKTRNQLDKLLQAHPAITVLPSATNFIHVEVPDAQLAAAGILEDSIAVAVFGSHGLRITIGTDAQMKCLHHSLAKHLPAEK